jgi:hypothetical protein
MAGPLRYDTVSVLGLTLSITNGLAYTGEMAIVIIGPLLSMRTTLVACAVDPDVMVAMILNS